MSSAGAHRPVRCPLATYLGVLGLDLPQVLLVPMR